MRKLRVLVLFDTDYPPPHNQDFGPYLKRDEAEFDVARTLRKRGHDVRCFGIKDDLRPLVECVMSTNVDVVFNLIERFRDDSALDSAVTGLLDLAGLPYTGAAPSGLILARDKARTKALIGSQGIPVPAFEVFLRGREIGPCGLRFPLIVKPLDEDASVGIARQSVVHSAAALKNRIAWVHRKHARDVIVEEFIIGRELYVGLMGDREPRALPPIEMQFGSWVRPVERLATFGAKWNQAYRKRHGIRNRLAANLPEATRVRIAEVAVRAYRATGLRDYGRIDIRLSPEGVPYVLEANPNPYLAYGEDLANAAEVAGFNYAELLEAIAAFAIERQERRKTGI